jgi:hypothetical protein
VAKQKAAPQESEKDRGEEVGQELATSIGRNVLTALGRPANFFKIVVVRLWERSYRVNVVTGEDPSNSRIAHSYFVVADDRGNVLESAPPIAKQY